MRRIVGSLMLLPMLLLVIAPAALAHPPTSPFSGRWVGTDPGDGSNLEAVISGGSNVRIMYTDDVATTACAHAATPAFTSLLTGSVSGDELHSTMRMARCGRTEPLQFNGLEITWWFDAGATSSPWDDVLTNWFGETFTRAQ